MIFTAIAYMLLAAIAVIGIGVLLLPVYLWVLHRDARMALQRAAELAQAQALLAEIGAEQPITAVQTR